MRSKFSLDEPNSGVLDYIEMGEIAQSRYDSPRINPLMQL